jgi:hypothetical protein
LTPGAARIVRALANLRSMRIFEYRFAAGVTQHLVRSRRVWIYAAETAAVAQVLNHHPASIPLDRQEWRNGSRNEDLHTIGSLPHVE